MILEIRREGFFICKRVNGFILKYILFYLFMIYKSGDYSLEMNFYECLDKSLEITVEEIEVSEGMLWGF